MNRDQNTAHLIRISHLLTACTEPLIPWPHFFLVTINTPEILPIYSSLFFSVLFDFLPEAESPGCFPKFTLSL